MTQVAPENEAQRRFWNEPGASAWTELQEGMDVQLAPLGDAAIEALGIRAGERIIDIGCGCGHTTLQVAELVGPTGSVVGVDISEPMLAQGGRRAAQMGLGNVSFVAADAQVVPVAALGGEADAIISRFGVMFFADPVAAFTNMLSLVKQGGRMSFVCWQSPGDNPCLSTLGRELAAMFPDQPPIDPAAPGPFAFADPARILSILGHAGWVDVEITPCVRTMKLFGADDFEAAVEGSLRVSAVRLLVGASEEVKAQARAVAGKVLRTVWTENGAMAPGAGWIVTATRSLDH
jgi:SAM-dependent methyltransferase